MGLLDEAIREHLELKRLHGADAGEVARQEHEALGPVRREDIAIPDLGSAALVPEAEPKSEPLEPLVAHEEPTVVVARPALEPVAPAPLAAPEPAPYAPDVGQPTVSFSLEDHQAAQSAAAPPADRPAPVAEPSSPTPVAEPSSPVPEPAPPVPDAPVLTHEEPLCDAPPAPSPESALDAPSPASALEPSWDAPPAPPAAADSAPVAPDVVPADDEPGEHDELEETPEFLQETPEHDRLWFEQKPPRDFDF